MNHSAASGADERPPVEHRMSTDVAFALAHLEHAVHDLLNQPAPSGNLLSLAARILDVQDMLNEKAGPAEAVQPSGGAVRSLEAAVRHLILALSPVVDDALAELQRVLVEMSDHGQR